MAIVGLRMPKDIYGYEIGDVGVPRDNGTSPHFA